MDKIIEYASYIILGISILISFINVLSGSITRKKIKASSEEEIKDLKSQFGDSKKFIKVIKDFIPRAVEIAEATGMDGKSKSVLALAQILLNCQEEDFDFTAHKDEIKQYMDDLIALTKKVNFSKSDPAHEELDSEPVAEAASEKETEELASPEDLIKAINEL